MNKYNNNFGKTNAGDPPIRFHKRSRYGTNNSSGNGSQRFQMQNKSSYQCSQKRNNTIDGYNCNQYDKAPSGYMYGISPKRQSNNQPQQKKQSSTNCRKSSITSSSSLSFSTATQNVLNLTQNQGKSSAQSPSATVSAQNIQPLETQLTKNVLDNASYYGFNYNNFFPNYNTDLIGTATSSSYMMSDGMNPFIWQTITSTPPPKLPQQQKQPPLPQQQPPPLPQQLPPPPLPSCDKLPHLPPPPPIPLSLTNSPKSISSAKEAPKSQPNGQDSAAKTIVKMKAKRKAMSMRYKQSKSWSEKDAMLALKAEETNVRKMQKDIILVIRFPDPEISREIVKCYSPDIESVHFQLNFAPRYCLVHLKPGTDVEKTIDNLSKIPFGTGFLSVEIKQIPHKIHSTKLNEIDPNTLYVGNLPTTIACKTLKEHFPGASRIDIGFAQRMKYTRYAFIRYPNVQQAIEAYKRMLDAEIGGRTLTIRFRRLAAANDGNKDVEGENNDDIQGNVLSQAAEEAENSSSNLCSTSIENLEQFDTSQEMDNMDSNELSSNNLAAVNKMNSAQMKQNAGGTDANGSATPINSKEHFNGIQASTSVVNIKPDPDVDPDDLVIRNTTIPRFEIANNSIKQEEENLALYAEFFEKPNNQSESFEKSNRSEVVSLTSTADEMDAMSTASTNSLGEFLQTCQQPQSLRNETQDVEAPPKKRNKTTSDISHVTIKKEPLENNTLVEDIQLFSSDSPMHDRVKQEPNHENRNLNTSRSNRLSAQETNPKMNKATRNIASDSDNGDIVPPTALFFRTDNRNMLANTTNDCDYDEFYETRASTSLANIKTEPTDTLVRKSILESNKNMQQAATLNRNKTISSDILSKQKSKPSVIPTSSISDINEDDDLVPPQNLLGTYQPAGKVFKQEMEHEDIFSIPFQIINVSSDNNDSVMSVISPVNNTANISAPSKTITADDNDDDVVIISDNRKSRTKRTMTTSNVDLTNFFLPKQTDLVSLKENPISVTIPNRESYKLLHRDDLDRLYAQLDADSDTEL